VSDIDIIKSLRERTGLSFKEIKKAVDEAGGDQDKAIEILKSTGAAMAGKKALRSTGQGIVEAYIHNDGKIGVLVQLLCETDFVARNPLFSELAHELSMHVAATDPSDTDELLQQEYVKDPSIKIQDLIEQYVAKLGENIRVGGFTRVTI